MPSPRFVYLDIAGTLLHKPGLAPAFIGALGRDVDNARFLATHKRVSEATTFPRETTAAFYRSFNASVLDALGVEPTPALLDAIERACRGLPWEPFDDVDALHGTRLPLGVISNWDARLREVIAATLPFRFDPIVDSSTTGIDKPDPRLYRHALELLDGTAPDEVVFVGDSLHLDAAPARAVGMRAVLLDRFDVFGSYEGDRIRSLAELPALLQA